MGEISLYSAKKGLVYLKDKKQNLILMGTNALPGTQHY